MSDNRPSGRGRVQLVALAAMFFGPALLAWAMVITDWRPAGTINHGELIEPPVRQDTEGWRVRDGVALTPAWFRGHWSWLVPVAGDCGKACAALLDELRRVRLALDKDADRIRVVLLQPRYASPPAPPARFPALELVTAPPGALAGVANAAASAGETEGELPVVVVDYLGFRMMAYPSPVDGSAVLDDMERLLKLAKEQVERYQQLEKGTTPAAD
ncbi:hypothetical protein [Arhodomonas sp. AD133]|uniref:hypothetical protein n=1 Tax=Arhodomonas sp. AD133 TaxID=3415009 RepID=UPI003EBD66C9